MRQTSITITARSKLSLINVPYKSDSVFFKEYHIVVVALHAHNYNIILCIVNNEIPKSRM